MYKPHDKGSNWNRISDSSCRTPPHIIYTCSWNYAAVLFQAMPVL